MFTVVVTVVGGTMWHSSAVVLGSPDGPQWSPSSRLGADVAVVASAAGSAADITATGAV